jgi:hypothetical protein
MPAPAWRWQASAGGYTTPGMGERTPIGCVLSTIELIRR